jgi:HTH-type transcriptional regulator / antitoxin MqsA
MKTPLSEGKTCPVCGEGKCKRKTITETFTYKGHRLAIPEYVVYVCSRCREEFLDHSLIRPHQQKIRDWQRTIDGLLSAEEIRRVRTMLGLTQEEFSLLLGGGRKAFARYETGAVRQSVAMDNLLRAVQKHPSLLLEFAKARGVALSPIKQRRLREAA